MREPAPALFPLFRSRLTTAMLTLLYVGGGEYSLAELSRKLGVDSGNMTREVARLEAAGVLTSRRAGRTKLVRADEHTPFHAALRDLVTITLGPATVLRETLDGLPGIMRAEIFGSWAARASGEPGPAPADIDLLVIGHPDRDDLHDAVMAAQDRLGREINVVVVAPERWRTSQDAFLEELRSRPMVPVITPSGDGDDRAGGHLGARTS